MFSLKTPMRFYPKIMATGGSTYFQKAPTSPKSLPKAPAIMPSTVKVMVRPRVKTTEY